jgi:hypothetical protein
MNSKFRIYKNDTTKIIMWKATSKWISKKVGDNFSLNLIKNKDSNMNFLRVKKGSMKDKLNYSTKIL